MQLSSLLSLAPLVGFVLADCHGSGESWGSWVPSVQSTLSSAICQPDQLSGSFGNAESKVVCLQLGEGIHADFEVQRKGGAAELSSGDCYLYLNREVEGCGQGGRSEYENWIFSADPNAGPC